MILPPVSFTEMAVRSGAVDGSSLRKFAIASSRLVEPFSQTISATGCSIANSPRSDRSRSRDAADRFTRGAQRRHGVKHVAEGSKQHIRLQASSLHGAGRLSEVAAGQVEFHRGDESANANILHNGPRLKRG